jgi:hypothetical protein
VYASFSLLAASLLVGQTAQTQYINPPASAGRGQTIVIQEAGQESTGGGRLFRRSSENRPFLSRLQNLFRRGDRNETSSVPSDPTLVTPSPKLTPTPAAPAPAAPTGEFLKKLPTSKLSTPASKAADLNETVSTASLRQTRGNGKSPIRAGFENKIGRDEKFEWVTGQLEVEGGAYKLYYATPETVDPHHGVVALDTSKVDMHGFRAGDLVSVHGNLTQRGRVVYHLSTIDLIERAKNAR